MRLSAISTMLRISPRDDTAITSESCKRPGCASELQDVVQLRLHWPVDRCMAVRMFSKKNGDCKSQNSFHLGFLGHESLPAVASLLVHTPSDHLGHLLRTSTCNGRAWHVYSNWAQRVSIMSQCCKGPRRCARHSSHSRAAPDNSNPNLPNVPNNAMSHRGLRLHLC